MKATSNYITLETHFGVPEHYIRATTRNKCSDDFSAIIQEIAAILYPNEEFDIFLLSPEPGSYKDIIKFVQKHKIGSIAGAAIAVGGLALGVLNYIDSHETHVHEKQDWFIDDTMKCLQLKKILEDLKNNYVIQDNTPEQKLKEVCADISIKQRKNSFYNTLARDGMIKNNEITLKDSNSTTVISKRFERNEFSKLIEPILDQKLSQQNMEGVVEINSPVFKQKREGKGIAWRGTYYGEDIYFKSVPLIKNGEDVEFYMQDQDFKSQIINKERTFAVGDNMRVIFDIAGDLKNGELQNRSIYIKEVKNYNEDVIAHKARLNRSSGYIQNGPGLF